MKYQEEFFHSQIEDIHKATEDKEKLFEKLLQEERSKARRFDVDSGTTKNCKLRCVTNSQLDITMPENNVNAPSQCMSCQELRVAFVSCFNHLMQTL